MSKRTAQESRKIILEAANEVFSERGYSRATIRNVAKKAGISVGGIYLYFQNKEELYVGLYRNQLDNFIRHTETLRQEKPLAALRSLIHSYMNYAVKQAKLVSMHIKEYDLEIKKPLKKAFGSSRNRVGKFISPLACK